jgi:hypothetical protein
VHWCFWNFYWISNEIALWVPILLLVVGLVACPPLGTTTAATLSLSSFSGTSILTGTFAAYTQSSHFREIWKNIRKRILYFLKIYNFTHFYFFLCSRGIVMRQNEDRPRQFLLFLLNIGILILPNDGKTILSKWQSTNLTVNISLVKDST